MIVMMVKIMVMLNICFGSQMRKCLTFLVFLDLINCIIEIEI